MGLYWSEGCKSKPHQRREDTVFVNSDPGMIRVYRAWLDLLQVPPERRQFRVRVHNSADVAGPEAYGASLVAVEVADLAKTTLKRHNPRTIRKNTGPDYRGCLTVRIRKGADLYRRIEGWWCGIVEASTPEEDEGTSAS